MLKFIQTSFIAIGLSKNYSDSITFLDKINFCLFMLLHELSCSFLSFFFLENVLVQWSRQTYGMTQAVEIRGTRKHTVFNWIKSGGGGWVCFKLADFWCPDFAILATFTVFKKPKHCEYIMNIGVTTLKYNHGTGLISKRIPRVFFAHKNLLKV